MGTVPSYLSDHQSIGLRRLLDDVRSGYLRVPRFQRPFIWSDSQRLELLNSIKRSMPIGSLLVWRTLSFELKCFDRLGPYAAPVRPTNAGVSSYLLDGHQRLTTLFCLLNAPLEADASAQSDEEDEKIRWDIVYNLSTEEFEFLTPKQKQKEPIISLWPLLNNRDLSNELRELQKSRKWSEEDWNKYEARAYNLAYAFQEYRLPIVAMVTEELELATTTFQRINSQGTQMSEMHLVTALTWTPEFDLREQIEELRKKLPVTWHTLDDKLYLQVCKGLLRIDMIATGQARLIDELRKQHDTLEEAGKRIQRAISFLIQNARVLSPELLPYSLQLLVLALELSEETLSAEKAAALLQWFWRSSWSGSFAGATIALVAKERELLRQLLQGVALPKLLIEPLPKRMDRRQARARTFTLRLLANLEAQVCQAQSPRLSNEDRADLHQRLCLEGTDALTRILPRLRSADEDTKRLLGSPANRRLPLNFSAPVPEYDVMSDEALQAYESKDMAQFLKLRMEYLIRWDLMQAQGLFDAELAP